jgi:hypothetical protein
LLGWSVGCKFAGAALWGRNHWGWAWDTKVLLLGAELLELNMGGGDAGAALGRAKVPLCGGLWI